MFHHCYKGRKIYLYLGEAHVTLIVGKFSYYIKAALTETALNGTALSGVTLYCIKNATLY